MCIMLFVKRVNSILQHLGHAPKLFTHHGTRAVSDVDNKSYLILFDVLYVYISHNTEDWSNDAENSALLSQK